MRGNGTIAGRDCLKTGGSREYGISAFVDLDCVKGKGAMARIETDTKVYQIARAAKVLRIDPALSLDAVFIDANCPIVLKDALQKTVVWQVRNETSVEKAVSAASLLPEVTLALLALDAHVLFSSGDTLALDAFYQRSSKRDVMKALLIPVVESRYYGTGRIGVSPSSDPIVAVAASVDIDSTRIVQTRIALFGVWPGRQWLAKSVSQLEGAELTDGSITQAAEAVMQEVDPKEDYHGSAEYRRSMAGVLVRRALEVCMKGAKES